MCIRLTCVLFLNNIIIYNTHVHTAPATTRNENNIAPSKRSSENMVEWNKQRDKDTHTKHTHNTHNNTRTHSQIPRAAAMGTAIATPAAAAAAAAVVPVPIASLRRLKEQLYRTSFALGNMRLKNTALVAEVAGLRITLDGYRHGIDVDGIDDNGDDDGLDSVRE